MADHRNADQRSQDEDEEKSNGLRHPNGTNFSSAQSTALRTQTLFTRLFDESHAAKIIKVAQDYLTRDGYPEYVPQDGQAIYVTKPRTFWTCGFLPGCLYALFERRLKFPHSLPLPREVHGSASQQLLDLCRPWNSALFDNALRTDTHDLGFMTIALRRDYELTMNEKSLDAVIKAAYNLASRYSDQTKCIRSWDVAVSHAYNITDKEENFLVIIDSMCNLDLLFYAANITGDKTLSDKATSHAHKLLETHIRSDHSTYHCANLDTASGDVKYRFSHQGYNTDSCWARGQAWALLGFVQTYDWTGDPVFLEASISIANYFCRRLSELNHESPYVPPWDFDAPQEAGDFVLRDTSAGMIAANGMILIHQALQGRSRFLDEALHILEDTLDWALAGDRARFEVGENIALEVRGIEFPAILKGSTVNNNEHALVRYSNHGLIYADYYFLELANKLLRFGLL